MVLQVDCVTVISRRPSPLGRRRGHTSLPSHVIVCQRGELLDFVDQAGLRCDEACAGFVLRGDDLGRFLQIVVQDALLLDDLGYFVRRNIVRSPCCSASKPSRTRRFLPGHVRRPGDARRRRFVCRRATRWGPRTSVSDLARQAVAAATFPPDQEEQLSDGDCLRVSQRSHNSLAFFGLPGRKPLMPFSPGVVRVESRTRKPFSWPSR